MTRLRRRFKEPCNVILLTELLRPLFTHFPLTFEIGAIPNQINYDVPRHIGLHFLKPFDDIEEGVFPGNIVGEEDAVGAPVKYASN